MQKISLFQLFILEIYSILEPCNQIGHTHFWQFPTRKIINQKLIFLNWYQLAKNQAISLTCSEDFVHLKILNLSGREHFGPYLRNKIFTKHILYTETLQII